MWQRLIIPFLSLVIGAQFFLYDFLRVNGNRDLELEKTMMQPPPINPRLEFFHIPKTGGTMLEALAGKNNVTWGACHFPSFPLRWKTPPKGEPWTACPRTARNDTYPNIDLNPWHMPVHVLRRRLSFDPYDNILPELAARPKNFFTVIRNPYDRIISTYYYLHAGPDFPNVNDSKELNAYILNEIRDKRCKAAGSHCLKESKCHGMFSCGTQHDFIFDGEKRVIDHVLHFETLQEDFEELSKLYSLNFTIPYKKPQKKHRALTKANLTNDSIRFINSVFRKDFDLGRGYEMIQVKDQDIRGEETVAVESITNKESIKPCLQFLHIPKTGGTVLEALERVLTAANLSDDSIRFINEKLGKDFDLGHGYEMIHPEEKKRVDIV